MVRIDDLVFYVPFKAPGTCKRGIHISFFLFLQENMVWVSRPGASNEFHIICFHGEIRKIPVLCG